MTTTRAANNNALPAVDVTGTAKLEQLAPEHPAIEEEFCTAVQASAHVLW